LLGYGDALHCCACEDDASAVYPKFYELCPLAVVQTMSTSISDIRWLRGGLYGAITYVTALLFTGLWYYFDHSTTPIAAQSMQNRLGLGVGSFYNGQFVAGGRDYLFVYGSTGHELLFTPLYRIIPVLVILLIGGAFVYTEADVSDRLGALLSGASLATGYVVLSLVVVLVFRSLAGASFLPIGMALVSGVLYPAVFGGLGGLAANELRGYIEEGSATPGVEENM